MGFALCGLCRFATLATRMEQYIQGQSRDLVDQAYTKFVSNLFIVFKHASYNLLNGKMWFSPFFPLFAGPYVYIADIIWQVSIMFVTLEKIAQTDLKYADIFLLENYAAFQNR